MTSLVKGRRVTQRDAPPRIQGIDDDEDEEKTSVGAAPDPEPHRPSPNAHGGPPRVSYGKFNTPTAFTPHQPAHPQAGQHHSPLHHDPRSSTAMTAARPMPA